MKTVVVVGTSPIQVALSWALSRLSYDVIISGKDYKDSMSARNMIRSAGGKAEIVQPVFNMLSSLYPKVVVSSDLIMTAHCMRASIACADMGGNVTDTATLAVDVCKIGKAPVFGDLGMVPNWSERLRTVNADHHWTKMQKALGFPAAAAVASLAEGHLPRKRGLRSYSDIPSESYSEHLKKIESGRPLWRGL